MRTDLPAPEMHPSAWQSCTPKARTPDEKDAYLNHLRSAIPALKSTGVLHSTVPWSASFTSSDASFTATLWVRSGGHIFNHASELQYALGGDPAVIDAERSRWKAVIDEADRNFDADQGEIRTWSAVIGPAPEQGAFQSWGRIWPMRLECAVSVGPMTVQSLDQWITQAYPRPSNRSRYYPVGFWPLRVDGSCLAHSTPGSQDLAAEALDRLCRLLTLATGIWWTHWSWPIITGRDQPAERTTDPVTDWVEEMKYYSINVPTPEPVTLDVPDWLSKAWPCLSSRASAGALEAYGSAVADIIEGRPSAAGALLMAVLERLTRLGRDQNKARKEAIKLVAEYLYGPDPSAQDRKRAEDLVMYDERSKTVHGGSRHGSEPRLNMPMRVVSIDRDPKDTYEKKVGLLLNVCRALLIIHLGGEAPSPEAVVRAIAQFEEGVLWL